MAAVGLLVGCGSTRHTTTTTATSSRAGPAHSAFSYLPGALVTMRQFSPESLLWQTISVKRDGDALLTTIIGEISGAVRRRMALSAGQTAKVRRLVAAARVVTPPRPNNPRAELCTLTLPGRQAESLQGRMPAPLAALVKYLSGLMFRYCC